MDSAEQTCARAEHEAKITFVGTILADAGCTSLYDQMTVEQVERLHDVILTRTGTASAVALHLLDWCRTMRHDAPPGHLRHTEGWNGALEMLANRIEREFSL